MKRNKKILEHPLLTIKIIYIESSVYFQVKSNQEWTQLIIKLLETSQASRIVSLS